MQAQVSLLVLRTEDVCFNKSASILWSAGSEKEEQKQLAVIPLLIDFCIHYLKVYFF